MERRRAYKSGSGARRRATAPEDHLFRILAPRKRLRTTRSITDQWYTAVGRLIRLRTVYHRLPSMDLRSYGRQRVGRLQGECRNLACAIERLVHHTIGITVWRAIAHGSTSLHVVRGTMTTARYVNEVLRPIVLPHVRDIEDGVFQQDNARPHIARASLTLLEEQHMEVLHGLLDNFISRLSKKYGIR
ncbi:hypothetical protein BDFB_008790 [Asbolus verrucosus]|uniref:DDE 3 domain containing protein n=1 Tax=Asbolus verrucosus TaxID=1661398 RepID=A0A482VXC3_ASBVE|nr:hypothetical protein BDFB_008790 [Asbolus verrucosus]